MESKIIHFIVNPISGRGKNEITSQYLFKYFNAEEYSIEVKYSKYKGHAVVLTKESILKGAEIIIACGGDGTINEVASCVIDTDLILGVIPIGSGNGLASSLNIPGNTHRAILNIKRQKIRTIDVGVVNQKYFFSNTGLGFDAEVVKNYETQTSRKLLAYLKAGIKTLKEWKKRGDFNLVINEKETIKNPFMIFISNSKEMGYGISLTPKASLTDGQLDVVIVEKLSKFQVGIFGFLVLIKRHNWLKSVRKFQTKKITIENRENNAIKFQIDGEFESINQKTINVSVSDSTIKILA